MKSIVLAGGTGLIGRHLEEFFVKHGHDVRVLTRNPKKPNHIYWNPAAKEMDHAPLIKTEVIVNLCGAGIAEKRWTNARKRELIDSRVIPAHFLFESRESFPELKQYISLSGATCYGYKDLGIPYKETDNFGTDFLSSVVEKWENAAGLFASQYCTSCLRTGIVLSWSGGALPRLAKPIKWGAAAAIGNGNQWMPWIHIDDVVRAVDHTIKKELSGVFNLVSGNNTNSDFTKQLATEMGKRVWLPNIPGFVFKLMLGEMSEMLLNGVQVDPAKLHASDFHPTKSLLRDALKQ